MSMQLVSNAIIKNETGAVGSADVKSEVSKKYEEFLSIMRIMSKALEDENLEVEFPYFPGQKVKSSAPSFYLYAQYSLAEGEKQIDSMIEWEKWKAKIEQQSYSLFG